MLTKQQSRCQLQCHQQHLLTVCVFGGQGGGGNLVNAQMNNDFLTHLHTTDGNFTRSGRRLSCNQIFIHSPCCQYQTAAVHIVLVAENVSVARLDRGLGDFVDGKSV